MPGWTSVVKYLNYSITPRKSMPGAPVPSVQNYAGAASQPLEKAAMLNSISICVIMYRMLSPAHRSGGLRPGTGPMSGSR